MKKFEIKSNGTFRLSFGDLDRASFYLVGYLGEDATVELLCYGEAFHTMEKVDPVIVTMGRGAPLEVRITGATEFTDSRLIAHEVR